MRRATFIEKLSALIYLLQGSEHRGPGGNCGPPASQTWKHSVIGTQSHSFVHMLSMAAFLLTGAVWIVKPETLGCTGKVCQSQLEIRCSQQNKTQANPWPSTDQSPPQAMCDKCPVPENPTQWRTIFLRMKPEAPAENSCHYHSDMCIKVRESIYTSKLYEDIKKADEGINNRRCNM